MQGSSKNLIQNLAWFLAALLLVALFFSSFYGRAEKPEPTGLTELVAQINNRNVSSIIVTGDTVRTSLKDGKELVTQKEPGIGVTETLINLGVEQAALQEVNLDIKTPSGFQFWFAALAPFLLPLIIIGVFFWIMFRQARSGMNQAFMFGRSSARLFSPFKDKVSFTDVAGLKEAKEELIEVVDFLKNPKKYLELGATIPRGVLLLGAPGVGKTYLARAVAGESNVPFFYISGSEFIEMFVGVGSSRVRDLFDTAKRAAPCIVFIDEIDAIGRERGAGIGGGQDEREQTLNQILVEMDGFDRSTRIIVLAATNRPDVLDRALLRPGRFDRRIVLDLPDINDREAILKIHSRGKVLAEDVGLRKVAERTPGFSGADLANLMNEAAIASARKGNTKIHQQEILESIEKVMLGPERRSRVLSEKEKEITAYHEAGHALVTAALKDADKVHKVSIVSRGMAGGYTMRLPAQEEWLRTKTQFMNDIAIMLGGYATEREVFHDISTGASNDLKHASELARRIVTQYGMSEKLGPIVYGKTEELVFLGREIATEKNYSERVASQIDDEVRHVIERALAVAKRIVSSKKRVLKAIADTLIKKETLEQDEFYALVKKHRLAPLAFTKLLPGQAI